VEALFCDLPIHDLLEHAFEATSGVAAASTMKAVPIVNRIPIISPNNVHSSDRPRVIWSLSSTFTLQQQFPLVAAVPRRLP